MGDATLLASLPGEAFAFVLVLARISGAVMVLPGIGEASIPTMVKAGLAVTLAILLLPILAREIPAPAPDPLHDAAMVGAELITGLWLGWLARLLLISLPMAGSMAAYMIGLSNVLQPDPDLGAQSAVLARLFSVAAPVLILSTGLYALPLGALVGTYRLIAPGTLLPAGDGVHMVVQTVTGSFALALRLAAPFVAAGLVWHALIATVSRLVPHLQVYFVAMPAQILGGIALLGLLGGPILMAWAGAVRAGFLSLPGVF